MLIFEALRAQCGDAHLIQFGSRTNLRLAVIDGGPPGVFAKTLRPRLEEIRAARGLDDAEPLDIDFAMVGHIDGDHVAGLLELVQTLYDRSEHERPAPWRIRRFWHNGFDDLVGNDDETVGTPASVLSPASIDGLLSHDGSNLLASIAQGRDLRERLRALELDGNPPFWGLIRANGKSFDVDGLEVRVIAPLEESLRALRQEWRERIQPLLGGGPGVNPRAELAGFLDKSVYDLASLVVLVECKGKRILLTGDARGGPTLAGLERAGLLDDDGRIEVDLLKVPHHGSSRDVDKSYFERIRAKHYVISADGKHDNPHIATLAMISEARPDDNFTIHLSYPTEEFAVPTIGMAVARFFARERAKRRKYAVEAQKIGALGTKVELS